MTELEHPRACDRPTPRVQLRALAGRAYVLTTCPRCGSQRLTREDPPA